MNTTAGLSNQNAENLRRINQRKGRCFIQALSDDEDDKDDEYDSRIFSGRNTQNLRRIKQRKGHCLFQALSDDEDDKDDDMIPPISFKISIPKYYHHSRTPLLKPVCRFVRFFQRTRESTLCMAFGA